MTTLNVMLDAIERGNHPYDDAEASASEGTLEKVSRRWWSQWLRSQRDLGRE